MHLKSLTLKGFKSFAQPTTFEFEPGVTCVVGPNGSGKSNVVDALAWVMGEQGAKTLRGGSMEDVIFAGTASKAPLGRAEVVLTIDNSDGALPIDYSEVTISRTLFRNGGSEYAINKEPCRLLDVQELLSDSGLGREMHVIVGQGQLDQVLHASADDRRRFIEEAAGILKHRKRKEKTERKLESMQANLTRLNDLAGEIRRQLTPLGRQADIAREAQTIQAVVRDAKARVLADDLVQLNRAVEDFHLSEQERATERTALADQLDQVRARIGELEALANDDSLERARAVSFGIRAIADRLVSLHSIAKERVGGFVDEDGLAPAGTGVSPADIERAEAVLADIQAEVERHEARVGEISAELATKRALLATLDQQREASAQAAADYDATARSFESALEIQRSVVKAAKDDVSRQRDALEQAKARSAEAVAERDRVEGSSTEAPDLISQAAEKVLDEAQRALESAHLAENEAQEAVHHHEREREALAARVSALELALRSSEGDHGLDSEKGVQGRVADTLTINAGYETAIATALGSLADALLVGSKKDALRLVMKTSEASTSRVEMVTKDGPQATQKTIAGLTAATSIAKGPSGVLSLLAQVYIAKDAAEAGQAWESGSLPAGSSIVTLHGDVFSDTVVRTGRGGAPSRLELSAEKESAQSTLTTVATTLERARFVLNEAKSRREKASDDVASALSALRETDLKRAEFGEQISRARAALEAAEAEVQRLQVALSQAELALTEAEDSVRSAEAESALFLQNPRPEVDDESRGELAATVESVSSTEVEARIALEAARERQRSASDVLTSLRQRVAEQEAAVVREQKRQQDRALRAARAEEVLKHLPALMECATTSVTEAGIALGAEEAKRDSRQTELLEARSHENTLRDRLSAITESVHALEMHIYEKRLQRTTLVERVEGELGLDEHTLLAEYSPDSLVPGDAEGDEATPFVRSEQENRLKQAQRKLDQLGRVNPLALEEFQALEKRHAFLKEQLEDLHQTRKDLESILADIDSTMHEIFHEAFVDTQKAFDEVFPILFPGGTGSLSLTEPDNLLTTGIDVAVRPAGKKIERLSLLSGGERSLAAVALLIAIFKARPSPFYILDEVEAALDDSNLGRLLSVIESLRQGSQLIVITHQKRTMEIADALYGVSMRKDGVSAVVGQRVNNGQAYAS